jgi:RNA polymerase sigma factor (sigma-70 family)
MLQAGCCMPETLGPRPLDGESDTLTRELLARYRAGDLRAERRLFERFRDVLLTRARANSLFRTHARHVSSEDVVQEVFWRAVSSGLLQRFEDRGSGSLERALVVILERTLVDTARRLGAQKRAAEGQAVELDQLAHQDRRGGERSLISPEATPTSRARAAELIQECRALLDDAEWDVWRMVELDGLAQVEVAGLTGSTLATVRCTLFRAREKLIRNLQPRHEERG